MTAKERANVRLDAERAAKLRQLQSSLRVSASEVVRRALDVLHRQQCESGARGHSPSCPATSWAVPKGRNACRGLQAAPRPSAGGQAWCSLTLAIGCPRRANGGYGGLPAQAVALRRLPAGASCCGAADRIHCPFND